MTEVQDRVFSNTSLCAIMLTFATQMCSYRPAWRHRPYRFIHERYCRNCLAQTDFSANVSVAPAGPDKPSATHAIR